MHQDSSQLGIMDLKIHDIEKAFGTRSKMNKAQRLITGSSAMTHAMVR